MKEENKKELTPSQYFDYLKEAKKTITLDSLKESFDVFIALAEKYERLGQVESLKKLCFLADTMKKEEKLIELGITTFVYRDVVEDYIENVADSTVKIIELSRYMREVPDDLVNTVEIARGIFDEIYIVFTDYTGKEERKVEKERRDKDPILFGVFKSNDGGGFISDRFYFIGDWVDEYCDLTLDKMVEQYKERGNGSPTITIAVPNTLDELLELMKKYKKEDKKTYPLPLSGSSDNPIQNPVYLYNNNSGVEKKKSFFDRVRSVFSLKNGSKN